MIIRLKQKKLNYILELIINYDFMKKVKRITETINILSYFYDGFNARIVQTKKNIEININQHHIKSLKL